MLAHTSHLSAQMPAQHALLLRTDEGGHRHLLALTAVAKADKLSRAITRQ